MPVTSRRRGHFLSARKRKCGAYIGLPLAVVKSPEWAALSGHATKLLIDLRLQFNGYNNGALCCIYSQMARERGWRSKDTLWNALQELIGTGFVRCTKHGKRIGGRHEPNRYRLTWERTDANWQKDPANQLPTHDYRNAEPWKRPKRSHKKIKKTGTVVVPDKSGDRTCASTPIGHGEESAQRKIMSFPSTPLKFPSTRIGHLYNLPGGRVVETELSNAFDTLDDDEIIRGCTIGHAGGCMLIGGAK